MADRFDVYPSRKRRPLPEVDPAVRKRFESLELGRRRPSERLVPTSREDAEEWNIPLGDAAPQERSHKLRWTLLGLLLLTAGLVVHGLVGGRPVWTAQEIRVVGNRSVESEPVLAALGLEPGVSWWRALSADRSVVLDSYPRLRDVSVRYRFPQGIVVEVNERVPVLRWLGDPVRVISEDGTILAGVSDLDPSDLPCLSAPGLDPGLPGRKLELAGAGDFWSQLLTVKQENADLWASISQVQYEGERRFRVFLRDPKRVVVWDPYLNAHLWARIPLVLGDLVERGLGTDAVLDLRFRDRIVVRVPEKEWYRLRDGSEAGLESESGSTGSGGSRGGRGDERGGRT